MANSILCIVPARGGSQRIPHKNIRDFFGRPVIAYGLAAARTSGLFTTIHVSTDSDEIRQVAEREGFPVEFLRDPALADHFTGLIPVYRWVVDEFARRGVRFDAICTLFPVCPLIEADDFQKSYAIFRDHGCRRPLYTVAPYPVPVEWAYHREANGALLPRDPAVFSTRSQDLAPTYYECGPISWFHPDQLAQLQNGACEGFVSYVLPRNRAIDVDNLEDWDFLEAIYRGRLLETGNTR